MVENFPHARKTVNTQIKEAQQIQAEHFKGNCTRAHNDQVTETNEQRKT